MLLDPGESFPQFMFRFLDWRDVEEPEADNVGEWWQYRWGNWEHEEFRRIRGSIVHGFESSNSCQLDVMMVLAYVVKNYN